MTLEASSRPIRDPDERFGGFRKSLLLRLDPGDLSQTAGPLATLAHQLVQSPATVQRDLFVDLIETEVATIAARVEETWRERVAGPAELDLDLALIVSNLGLEAEIGLPPGRAKPLINLALGAVLALDDLVLFALTSGDVLIPDRPALAQGDPATQFETATPLDLVGAGRDRDDRFVDYADALGAEGLDRAELTHAMAAAPWRLAQASLMSELAVAWVLLHERAHWALAHLDLLGEGGQGLHLNEVGQTALETTWLAADRRAGAAARLAPGAHQMLEIQADTQAFLLLCDYAMRLGGAADRYEAIANDFDIPDDPRTLRKMGFGRCLRLCLTAASLACLAFDAAKPERQKGETATHPSPGARLMNMMINAPLVSDMVKEDENGDWVLMLEDRVDETGRDNEAFHDLTNAMGMALTDLFIVSSAIGADFVPLQQDAQSPTGWSASQWLLDMMTFWIADEIEEPACETAAGIELGALKMLNIALPMQLIPLQERRFGAPMTVKLSDMWIDRPI